MRGCIAAWLLTAGGALAAAPGVAEEDQQQKTLGSTKLAASMTGLYLSCEETYGAGWEKCGGQTSRLCYSPAFGQSCCEVDNGHCGKGTWCAPVAGYCCLDSEDLETCARNAGFEVPENETPRDLKRSLSQTSTPLRRDPAISGARAPVLTNRDAGATDPTTRRAQLVQRSTATKEQRTLGWMGIGIGTVGLIMAFC